jgi:NADH:ubiquinone oxidoreductase subunit 6 (subunit J)
LRLALIDSLNEHRPFIIIAILTLAGALAAASLPKLIHAALCLVVAFVGIAAFFFCSARSSSVQVFVYVGAVAVLIVSRFCSCRTEENMGGFRWGGRDRSPCSSA